MTPALMAHRTKRQLAELDRSTKAELAAWVRNAMTPVICNADLVAINACNGDPEGTAQIAARSGRRFLAEFEQLLEVK